MSVQTICNQLNALGIDLLESEHAIDFNQHKVDLSSNTTSQIIWARDPGLSLIHGGFGEVEEYLSILRSRDYSILMFDGGIIQIAYTFAGRNISRHRLSYHPCPFDIADDIKLAVELGVIDYIEEFQLPDLRSNLRLRSPLRFDFAPQAMCEYHPASHMTVQKIDCRIPVASPLNLGDFMKFVMENFYLGAWIDLDLRRRVTAGGIVDCLSEHDRGRIYMQWT